MNILMILSNSFTHDPRVFIESKSLIEKGYNVKIISWDRKNECPIDEWINGCHIIRVQNKGIFRILPGYTLKNILWWRKAYTKGLKLFNKWKFDVVHCHDLDTLQSGVWLKKKIGCKLIYDAHETFGYMIEGNVNPLTVKFAFQMEKKLISYADYIITVDESYIEYFKKITNKSLIIIRNCKNLMGKYQKPFYKTFTLIYTGSLTTSRFFPQIIHTIGKMKNVKFIIIAKKEGIIYDKMKNIVKKYNNIQFLNPILPQEVLFETRKAHVVICMFDPTNKMDIIASPNKLFEAMITGRPVIATKRTNTGNIVEQENCGLTVEYSEKSLKDAIKILRDDPLLAEKLGRNGLESAKEKYNWKKQETKLLDIYKNIN